MAASTDPHRWFVTDVVRRVFAFLRPVAPDLAAVHPLWYRLVRERGVTLRLRPVLLADPRAIRRAIALLEECGPTAQRLFRGVRR